MPSDDTPEFQRSQRDHSDKLKSERAIIQTFGVNRSQARDALREFAARKQQAVVEAQVRSIGTGQPQVQAPLTSTTTTIEAKPFRHETGTGGASRNNDSTGGATIQISGNLNGSPATATVTGALD